MIKQNFFEIAEKYPIENYNVEVKPPEIPTQERQTAENKTPEIPIQERQTAENKPPEIPTQERQTAENKKDGGEKGCKCKTKVPFSLMRIPHSPTLSILLAFNDGVAYESREEWGISHFMEHIFFRGTENIPTLYDISRKMEGIGGRISAYSTRDMTAFWVKVPPGCEDEALWVLEELLLRPSFKEEFIRQEREIITQERHREINNPSFFNSIMMEGILLHPFPLSRHPVGEDEVINNIDSHQLSTHLKKAYHRGNMYVGCAGNMSGEFKDKLVNFLNKFPSGDKNQKANFILEEDLSDHLVFYLPSAHKTQAFLSVGWKFEIDDFQEIYTWRAFNSLVGSGYTSIFNRVLREQENITYLCTTGLNFYDNDGIFKINLSLADKNVGKAIELIQKIIQDIGQGKTEEALFKESLIKHASHILFRMEDSLELAKILGHNLLKEERGFSFREYFNNINKVNLEDISRICRIKLPPHKMKTFIQTGSTVAMSFFPQYKTFRKTPDGKIVYA